MGYGIHSDVAKRLRRSRALALTLPCLFATGLLCAQEPYRQPPQVIVDMLEAPPSPSVSISPDGNTMLMLQRESMPSLEDLARPMLRLAGFRINANTNGAFTTRYLTGLRVKRIDTNQVFTIDLPIGAKFSFPRWSPD
ncbi:MAG: hypothetical protein O7G85_00890, partial [Planctomycetota bacterium]|nr:hypothetical protein [Planctomycetota bacterium]